MGDLRGESGLDGQHRTDLTNTLISTIIVLVSSAKTLPFETTLMVRDRCLCLHVQRAARALARRFDEELRPFELTNGQFSLLMSLNRPEPPPMGPVASLLAMDRTTLTAALKPLERRGLFKVENDPTDRRSRILILTEKGRNLLARAASRLASAPMKRLEAELQASIGTSCARICSDLLTASQHGSPGMPQALRRTSAIGSEDTSEQCLTTHNVVVSSRIGSVRHLSNVRHGCEMLNPIMSPTRTSSPAAIFR